MSGEGVAAEGAGRNANDTLKVLKDLSVRRGVRTGSKHRALNMFVRLFQFNKKISRVRRDRRIYRLILVITLVSYSKALSTVPASYTYRGAASLYTDLVPQFRYIGSTFTDNRAGDLRTDSAVWTRPDARRPRTARVRVGARSALRRVS
ncbi:hypothetical protein EVAR_13967_1 [Eumeta japonica]|uniref:Uncharacterized protein n=1 Tax=Eumeta variegata TaxID=151549 RepID=A0A4C1U9W9_EUMVA|nr:hypothetical protein EVAR_13967_1 [Eumeta japonica]